MSRLIIDDFSHSLELVGSPRNDAFRSGHKKNLGPGYYASDIDLVLVEKDPAGVVAFLDCKQLGEPLSMAEVILYNDLLLAGKQVYIVEVDHPERGPFVVARYLGGDWRPRPPEVRLGPPDLLRNWEDFQEWEKQLRASFRRARSNTQECGPWPSANPSSSAGSRPLSRSGTPF